MLSRVLGIFPIRDRIKPLRKLRPKPQVSEAFDAKSIRIDAQCIRPEELQSSFIAKAVAQTLEE